MSDFTVDWLSLREPADHAAREHALTLKLANWASSQRSLSVLDLGTGTGSNFRFLAPRLGRDQHWRLVDNDANLLTALPERLRDWASRRGYRFNDRNGLRLESDDFSATVECASADLANGIGPWLNVPTQLVTASALLDLVSADWIETLAADCAAQGCAACFALNYTGQVQWQPAVADDDALRTRLNSHQKQPKGLGMALGPDAGNVTADRLRAAGLDVITAPSDWCLDRQQADLQLALARGWVAATIEQDPGFTASARHWLKQRESVAITADARVIVGHVDVLGLPNALRDRQKHIR